jgi:hypothetical protein
MRSNGKNKSAIANFLALSDAAKENIFHEFDDEFVGDTFAPLSKRQRALWRKARQAQPNHRQSDQVLIPMKRTLLERAEAYAKSHGTTRSKLIAKGLKLAMSAR